ncbi:ribonuclease P protein component [Candidatus Pelagibacter sp.]|uniref:ribonuclease P protein component n=1 Tax=Candidatus Pelagibacter sp. TaxID=2024849 RepID=UPI003F83DD4E
MKSKIVALSKNEEFKNLLKQKKFSNKYVTIFFGKLMNKNNNKLNISFVTKKKLGNAVKRNKIKRRLRNILNEAVKKISINFNYSFLVIAKSSMLNNEYKLIKETLFQDFKKIK